MFENYNYGNKGLKLAPHDYYMGFITLNEYQTYLKNLYNYLDKKIKERD